MGLRTDISTHGSQKGAGDQYADGLDVDVLIIGAGFGGVYLLHRLRDELGMQVKVWEAGADLGGIWHWNCYPGARVDSPIPVYEYSLPEVYKNWTWSCKYPGYAELRDYFNHVDRILDVKKDVAFNTRAVDSRYNAQTGKWTVKAEDGRTATCNKLMVCTGFAAKRHIPDWPGLEKYQGEIHHSSFWPDQGIDTSNKRVAVIGTGATGIQLSQQLAKESKHLTVFVRTPNLCLPMQQEPKDPKTQTDGKGEYTDFFKLRKTTFSGFPYDSIQKNTMDDTPEEREKTYDGLFERGGFEFWLANYKDLLFDHNANVEAYKYWAKRTRARISDPVKRDILAPAERPHYFGTKRPSLEQDYYESMDRANVDVVDLKKTPIVELTEKGIKTSDGKVHELDMIALATGFDSLTGGMRSMGLKDSEGVDLSDKWAQSAYSYLGTTVHGYPNMFFLYGVQGPTAFSNGPTCVEVQGDWIFKACQHMKEQGVASIEATHEAELEWHKKVQDISNTTLFPHTKSWYMGANIPGKKFEQLNYAGGFPKYIKELNSVFDGWKGFELVRENGERIKTGKETQTPIQHQRADSAIAGMAN